MNPANQAGVRELARRKLARINRMLVAGSVALTAVFAEAAAQAFPGRTASTRATAKHGGAKVAKQQTTHTSTTASQLSPPASVPQAQAESSAAPSESSSSAESSRPSAPSEGSHSSEASSSPETKAAPETHPAPESSASSGSAPATESAPSVSEGEPSAATPEPVVSGGS